MDRSWYCINRSQIHEVRNWERGRAVLSLGIFVSNFRYSAFAVHHPPPIPLPPTQLTQPQWPPSSVYQVEGLLILTSKGGLGDVEPLLTTAKKVGSSFLTLVPQEERNA